MAKSSGPGRKPANLVAAGEEWFRPNATNAATSTPSAFNSVANGLFGETDPFQVNTITASIQDEPAIAALPSGGFVAAWMTGQSVKVQLFDRHGEKLGSEFTAGAMTMGDPAVVGLAAGGFVVSWVDFESGDIDIWARMFDAAGTPVGGQFRVSTDSIANASQPSLAALSSGGFVASWTDQDVPFSSLGIKAQIFDALGAKVGGDLSVNTTTGQDQYYSAVAGLPGGGFVIAWTDQSIGNPDDTTPTAVRAQLFDAAGAKVGGEFLVNSAPGEQYFETVTVLASGNFVIAWSERTSDVDVKAQIFSPTGTRIGAEFLINTTVAANQEMVSLAALPDGGFLASWRDATGTGNFVDDGEIRAQLFDAVGARVGGEFMVNVGTAGGQSAPQVAAFGSGDFAIAWVDFASGGSEIKARSYFSVTMGTNAGDSFAGTGDRDFYQGLDGDDQIAGAAGGDGLNGGDGNDFLDGGEGNDFLDGGPGADTLLGGAGDDVYSVESAGDVIVESQNGGRDVIYTSVSHTLGADVHVEALSTDSIAGTNAINLTGNGFNNEIYGNNGANTLNGGGGGDYLVGWGGDDTYLIFSGAEIIVENVNGGRDVVYTAISYGLAAGTQIEVLSTDSIVGTNAINLTGNELNNEIYGNNGANLLNGGGGAGDYLVGWGGDDVYLIFTGGEIVIENAGGGRDVVYSTVSYGIAAGTQVEVLSTDSIVGTSAINLTGNELNNEIYGNNGANMLNGGGGAGDYLVGWGGDDTYLIFTGGEIVVENVGGGRDVVYSTVSYALAADTSVEVLSTDSIVGTNAINLTGNEIGQEVYGNNGANTLNGGAGGDYLVGNGGADIFAFTTALGGGNIDTIADFQVGTDSIRLAGAAGQPFAALATGTLAAGAFVIGTAAADANDYLIYNSGTGALMYDADGNGAGAAVQFATLATGLGLTAASFTVSGPANNAPAITSGGTASVAENSAASTIVYQTAATDADGDRITYSLTGADASLLTIDASGAVRLVSPADFETKATYSFNVVASDSAASTSRGVTLTITNVTESAPTPIINETGAANDTSTAAQVIDRNLLAVSDNPNLHNDDLPSATIVGSIALDTDRDFFSITLQAGEQLILDVDGTTGGLDSLLRLYNSSAIEIGDNDDRVGFDPGSNPPFGHNTDSQIIFRAATSGTYYFSIESFEGTSAGNYQLHVSIGPPATPQQLVDEDVDALISGSAWTDHDLTYGFPTLAGQYPASFEEPDHGFAGFTPFQQAQTIQLIQMVANVSALTFSQNTASPGDADLRYATSTTPDVAYAYYPTNAGPSSLGGSAWFNNGANERFLNPVKGNYAWMGILHETGHALGLKHGHEFPLAISADRDSVEYSVMTYRSYPGDSTNGGYSNEQYGYPQTLMMYDVAALQEMYGANFAYNSGNSVYTWTPNAGETFINGVGQGAVGDGGSGLSNRVFLTIWDGGGTDTYDLSAYATATTIDLRPGEWTTTSSAQLANLGAGHSARGNIANALMYQGNAASLIENAVGGSAGDTIIANQAANSLTGGGGADTFTWKSNTHAGVAAAADTITDFLAGTDKIRLSDIDTNPGTGGDDAFTFIGTGAFTSTAGQVRYQVEGGNLRIQADYDGNGVADMEIFVNNNTIITASDFFL
jgi:Ca2+-binding RTX toxin-like protein